MSKILLPMLSSRSFMVSGLILESEYETLVLFFLKTGYLSIFFVIKYKIFRIEW